MLADIGSANLYKISDFPAFFVYRVLSDRIAKNYGHFLRITDSMSA